MDSSWVLDDRTLRPGSRTVGGLAMLQIWPKTWRASLLLVIVGCLLLLLLCSPYFSFPAALWTSFSRCTPWRHLEILCLFPRRARQESLVCIGGAPLFSVSKAFVLFCAGCCVSSCRQRPGKRVSNKVYSPSSTIKHGNTPPPPPNHR